MRNARQGEKQGVKKNPRGSKKAKTRGSNFRPLRERERERERE